MPAKTSLLFCKSVGCFRFLVCVCYFLQTLLHAFGLLGEPYAVIALGNVFAYYFCCLSKGGAPHLCREHTYIRYVEIITLGWSRVAICLQNEWSALSLVEKTNAIRCICILGSIFYRGYMHGAWDLIYCVGNLCVLSFGIRYLEVCLMRLQFKLRSFSTAI